jgi:hypothetical protein
MNAAIPIKSGEPRENLFSAADVNEILHERGWLHKDVGKNEAYEGWIARAAFLLGLQAADHAALAELLALVFNYEAQEILRTAVSHAVLSREGARDVIRELALAVLEGPAVDSERFSAIINGIKSRVSFTGRELFYPMRLALAGRVGGGELDRVILLLDSAAATPGIAPVKNVRQRMMEFCAALE